MSDLNAQAIIDAARQGQTPHIIVVNDIAGNPRQVVVTPDGKCHSARDLTDEYDIRPDRRKGTIRIHDRESMIEVVDRFKDAGSVLYADIENRTASALTAIFDYHEGAGGSPRFGEHRAVYKFPFSDEWKAWIGVNGKALGQRDFAEWIELHALDLTQPDDPTVKSALAAVGLGDANAAAPARIQEVARGLSIRVDERVQQAVTLTTGECRISYEAKHDSRDDSDKPITVPALFAIAIPVFRDGVAYVIPVRLRYRVSQGTVTWTMILVQSDHAYDVAVREVCTHVADKTALPLFYGTPET